VQFEEVTKEYKLIKKNNNGIIYTLYWHLGFAMARVFNFFKITPNAVSVFSLLFYVIAGYFFYFGGKWSMFGGLSFFLGILMDCTDGKMARMTNRTSKLGIWLDYNFDYLRPLFIYPPIAISLQRSTGEFLYVYLAYIAISATLVYTIIGMRWDGFEFAQKHKQGFVQKSKFHILLKQFYFLEGIEPLMILFFILLNRLDLYLIIWTIGITFTYLFSAFSMGIIIHNQDMQTKK